MNILASPLPATVRIGEADVSLRTGYRMHWWAFMAYFDNLSADSEVKRAMYYRYASRPRDMTKGEAKRFHELKRAYALPPRTVTEAEAREAELWGDD